MKKELQKIIEIPEGIEIRIEGNQVSVKGNQGELSKTFKKGSIDLAVKEKKVLIGHKKATKKEKKMINTIYAHINNMIKGVQEKFEYILKVCYSHFPFNVEISGNSVVVKNFLGEKSPRKVKIPEGVEATVDKQEIKIVSIDKEKAGQAAANLEKVTRVRGRDRRIFQDGIFMVEKAGREI